MIEELERVVDGLDVPPDGAALRRVHAVLDRLQAKATVAAAAFDAAQLWDLDGATSMTGWLRHHTGMTAAHASRTVSTGRRLRSCPVTADAWTTGVLSGGQVAAIVANVNDDTAALFAAHEADLVPTLTHLPVTDVATAMGAWRARAAALVDTPEPPEPDRSLHLSPLLDGRAHLTATLDAEAADVVATALRTAATGDTDGEPPRTPARRRADALTDLCRWFLDHHTTTPAGTRHRPHVNLIVDLDARTAGDPAAAHTSDGITLTPHTTTRLLCDAGVHRVVTRGRSTIIDYGRTTRTIPAPLFNSLTIRDRHCRWPGCDRPPSWCEGHHLIHWEHGGTTALPNLALLCTRHHHRAHTPGWHAKLLPDATFTVTTPTGQTHTTRPPPRC